MCPRSGVHFLQDLDPVIDADWEDRIAEIMRKMGATERRYADSQFIEPKGIRYLPAEKRFTFEGRESVQKVAERIKNPELRSVAVRLSKAREAMDAAETPEQFANHLESALTLFDNFDAQENLPVQKDKNALRSAFLTELVAITRAANFKIAPNRRGFSTKAVKDYIIEIFIKQQILGYRFRTLPIGTLEEDPNPFLCGVVAEEAKTRQCDIVKTATLIYLIAPVKTTEQNPYSIRRFLREEEVMRGSVVYFNAAIISLGKRLQDEKYQHAIGQVLSRMVTLQRQLSDSIVELLRGIDEFHRKELSPLLTRDLEADGTSIEQSISKRLDTFEQLM